MKTTSKAHSPPTHTTCWEVVVPPPPQSAGEWRKEGVGQRGVHDTESKIPTGRDGSRVWSGAGH